MPSCLKDILQGPPAQSPERLAADAERALILYACILALTARQRLLIELRYVRGLTLRAIAMEFQVGEPAVHAMHQRAMSSLLRELEKRQIRCLSDLL